MNRGNKNSFHSRSVRYSSDADGDVIISEPCGPCARKESDNFPSAEWYCQQCEDSLCKQCKSFHDFFKTTASHTVTSLRPNCGPCEMKESQKDAQFFCNDCEEFLCMDCRSYHRTLKILQKHDIITCEEKVKQQKSGFKSPESHKSPLPPKLTCVKERTLESKFNPTVLGDKSRPYISGMQFLPDSRLLVVDRNNSKLKLFDQNFQCQQTTQFHDGNPWDIAVLKSDEVSVTFPDIKTVRRLSIKVRCVEEKLSIKCSLHCTGIAYIDSKRLAVLGTPTVLNKNSTGVLLIMDLKGNELTTILADAEGDFLFKCPRYLAVNASKTTAYVSDWMTNAVISLDLATGIKGFKYSSKELKYPYAVGTDGMGNIYICGFSSNNIHKISEDGKISSVLLSAEDGVGAPRSLAINPYSKELFLWSFLSDDSIKCF